ncbi:MAG: hypothetical protein KatS3mg115_0867 [Candidatus Poribacteria bacterium]|nr:MAG: hypothetical protein KatS3mg115_0867 [Candidatus Poribacteria bacterium]
MLLGRKRALHTPSHVLINLAVLGHRKQWARNWAVGVGGALPDAPIFLFFLVERFVRGASGRELWGARYFDPAWQALFDLFHSFPIWGALGWVAWRLRWRRIAWLVVGVLFHSFLDLLLHHDDGHRHLFPFSDWRFLSPVSYWDPAHWGLIGSGIEWALVVAAGWRLWSWTDRRWLRGICAACAGLFSVFYLGYCVFTLTRP